jgi:hypothetical protein
MRAFRIRLNLGCVVSMMIFDGGIKTFPKGALLNCVEKIYRYGTIIGDACAYPFATHHFGMYAL